MKIYKSIVTQGLVLMVTSTAYCAETSISNGMLKQVFFYSGLTLLTGLIIIPLIITVFNGYFSFLNSVHKVKKTENQKFAEYVLKVESKLVENELNERKKSSSLSFEAK